jgi:hypothetical protein
MIQRIQSLYLAIVVLASVLLFFFPLALYYNELSGNYKLFITGLQCMDPDPKALTGPWFTIPLAILAGAIIVLTGITLFLFKNRLLQIKLIAVDILLHALLIALSFLYYTGAVEKLTQITPVYQMGLFFPIVALVMLLLANRAIRKDESLVKSADRLR